MAQQQRPINAIAIVTGGSKPSQLEQKKPLTKRQIDRLNVLPFPKWKQGVQHGESASEFVHACEG